MRRACGEYSGERVFGIAARVHFEHLAIRTVKPRDDDDLVIFRDSEQSAREGRIDFEPCVRCTFRPLTRCLTRRPKRRADVSDTVKRVFLVHLDLLSTSEFFGVVVSD